MTNFSNIRHRLPKTLDGDIMGDVMNVLISACLLGRACRYDGKSKKCIGEVDGINWIPVCPECDGGLPTPRAPAEIVGERVINSSGVDVTAEYEKGAEIALQTAVTSDCRIAVLKERSPSCGTSSVYDGSFSGKLCDGMGITARLLSENGIRVVGESEFLSKKQEIIKSL